MNPSRTSPTSHRHRLLGLALLGAFASTPLTAAVWSGLDVDDALWTSPDNWVGGTPPGFFENAEFGVAPQTSPDLDDAFSIDTLRFLPGAPTYTLESTSGFSLGLVNLDNASGTEQYVYHGLDFNAGTATLQGDATVFVAGSVLFNADAVVEAESSGAVVVDLAGSTIGFGAFRVGRDYGEFEATAARITSGASFDGNVEINGRLEVVDGFGGAGTLSAPEVLIAAPNNFNHDDRGELILGGEAPFASGMSDRLNDTAVVRLENGSLFLGGDPVGDPLSETIAELRFDRGHSLVEIRGQGGDTVLFVDNEISSRFGATAELVYGDASASLEVSFGSGPELIGGSGLAGDTNQPIVPWLSGGDGSRLDLVTFDDVGSVRARPLTASEYQTDINLAVADDNVDVASPSLLGADTEVNAVRLAENLDLDGNRLTVGSGAVLLVEAGTLSNGTVDFGGRDGYIVSSGFGGAFDASISGLEGVTFSGFAPLTLLRPSDYSGGTFINADINVRTDSPFGDATGVVVLAQDVRVLFEPGATSLGNPVVAEGSFTALDTVDTHVVYTGALDILHPRQVFTAVYVGSEYTGGDTGSGYTFDGPITAYTGTALAPAPGTGTTGTFNGVIGEGFGGNLFIFKVGGGTTVLNAANTFTGGVLHIDGTLLVNNTTGSGTGTGFVNVDGDDAVLGGTGTIAGDVAITNGTLAPGNSPGVLTLGSDLTFADGTTFAVELFGTGAGEFDQVLLTSSSALVDLGFNALLDVSLYFSPSIGDTFTVIDASAGGSIVGTFSGLPTSGATLDATYGLDTFTFAITYNADSVVLEVLEVIPEPGSAAALLGLAALGLLAVRRRQRTSHSG